MSTTLFPAADANATNNPFANNEAVQEAQELLEKERQQKNAKAIAHVARIYQECQDGDVALLRRLREQEKQVKKRLKAREKAAADLCEGNTKTWLNDRTLANDCISYHFDQVGLERS